MKRKLLVGLGAVVAIAAVSVPNVMHEQRFEHVIAEPTHSGCPDLAAAAPQIEDLQSGCPADAISEAIPTSPVAILAPAGTTEPAESVEITVYKTPTCGCCHQWIDLMRQEGLNLKVEEVQDIFKVMDNLGISRDLVSCHTSIAAGYFLQGHIPADAIRRLLNERPAIRGLAVVGMPSGAPGMGGKPGGFDVLAVNRDGSTSVFAHY
jgi:hypothetical protein